jgi:hypothetical protein
MMSYIAKALQDEDDAIGRKDDRIEPITNHQWNVKCCEEIDYFASLRKEE